MNEKATPSVRCVERWVHIQHAISSRARVVVRIGVTEDLVDMIEGTPVARSTARPNEEEISHGRVPWQFCSQSLNQRCGLIDWLGLML